MKLNQLHEQRFLTDKEQILEYLKKYLMLPTASIEVTDEGIVNVHDNGVLFGEVWFPHGRLLVKFGRVHGSFSLARTNVTTLEGCPHSVEGAFYCGGTQITSLVGGPRSVGDNYYSSNTNVNTLEGFPEYVEKGLVLYNTKLTNLHNIHKVLHRCGSISVEGSSITSHILGLMLIKDLKFVSYYNTNDKKGRMYEAFRVIAYCIKNNEDIHRAQEMLLEAGLSEFAKL